MYRVYGSIQQRYLFLIICQFNAKYNATYTWDRGAQISEEID